MLSRARLVLVSLLLSFASVASAQLNLTYTTFQPQSTISSAQFTSNFTNINDKALNRYAGILSGVLLPDTDATRDIGSLTYRFRDGFFSRNVTVAGTLTVSSGTLTCTNCIGATQLASTTVAAGSYGAAASVGTFTVDADGRLTAGANVAIQIAESQITDGALLARVGEDQTVTATWTFTQAITAAGLTCTQCIGATQLTASGVTAGTYGSAAVTPVLTIDEDGRVTAASTVAPTVSTNPLALSYGYSVNSGTRLIFFTSPDQLALQVAGETALSATTSGVAVPGTLSAGASSFTSVVSPSLTTTALDLAISNTRGGAGGTITIGPAAQGVRVDAASFIPATNAATTLGSATNKFANINLNLTDNNAPSYVVVNKGGVGTDSGSALGYISAGDRTITIGGCTLTVKAGLITNAVGC